VKKISFCIILYNKSIEESQTINTLVYYFKKNNILGDIVVFNNGPNLIKTQACKYLQVHNILINASLSRLYNKFITEFKAEYYVFMDDDTNLCEGYLNELSGNKNDIFFPRILCDGTEHYPVLKNNKIQTITSGLTLSSIFCKKIISKNGTIFDERFDLYGIDTAFCNLINKNKLPYSISDNIIEHDLSHISSGDNSFREIEVLLANSASLIQYFSIRLLLSVLYGQFKMIRSIKISVLFSSIISICLKRTIRTWRY
jgi:hypothetical protein